MPGAPPPWMAVEAAECRETAVEAEWPLRTEVADVEAPDSLLVSLWVRTEQSYSLSRRMFGCCKANNKLYEA